MQTDAPHENDDALNYFRLRGLYFNFQGSYRFWVKKTSF